MRKIKKQAETQIGKMKGKRRNYTDCTCNNIIVLLILAGVSIATLTGDNRNFNTSPKCKE